MVGRGAGREQAGDVDEQERRREEHAGMLDEKGNGQ